MKRDMDLIRKVLLKIEEKEDDSSLLHVEVEGYDQENVDYHVRKLHSAKLIYAIYGDGNPYATDITWEGHEFLDNVKNESVWKKTKDVVVKNGGTASFAIVTELAKELALKHFLGK